MSTFETYIKQMISEGYWSEKDLTPLKCKHCDSKNLKWKNFSYDETILVAYDMQCENCLKIVGSWSYGSWEI